MQQFALVYHTFESPFRSIEEVLLYNLTDRTFKALRLTTDGKKTLEGDWVEAGFHMHSLKSLKESEQLILIDSWKE